MAVALLASFLMQRGQRQANPARDADATLPPQMKESAATLRRAVVQQVHLARYPVNDTSDPGRAAEDSLRVGFNAIYQHAHYFDKEALEAEVFDELAQDAACLRAAEQVLTDPTYAKARFGDDQAVMRVYSIRLLRRRAAHGDAQPLVTAIRSLTSQLLRDGERLKGQVRDLEDLVRAAAQTLFSDEEVIAQPSALVTAILGDVGAVPSTEQERHALEDAIAAGVTLPLAVNLGDEEQAQFTQRARTAIAAVMGHD